MLACKSASLSCMLLCLHAFKGVAAGMDDTPLGWLSLLHLTSVTPEVKRRRGQKAALLHPESMLDVGAVCLWLADQKWPHLLVTDT